MCLLHVFPCRFLQFLYPLQHFIGLTDGGKIEEEEADGTSNEAADCTEKDEPCYLGRTGDGCHFMDEFANVPAEEYNHEGDSHVKKILAVDTLVTKELTRGADQVSRR